jgi:penicillin-binding protein activator
VRIHRLTYLMTTVSMLAALVLLAGCGGGKAVTRIDTDTTIDLSGRWNDADSRMVAEELIAQATSSPWVENHLLAQGKKPAVIVGDIVNKSSEHIPVEPFMADVERAFINSGRVRMVATAEQRQQLRDERADQQQYSSEESMKQWGRELGADYMMLGSVNTIIDREGGDEVKFYQVDVYLIDLEDSTKSWAGFKKIKKYVSRDGYRP